ncbi:MAG: TonB-dependent receptor, partial [Terriglobia bacterium]
MRDNPNGKVNSILRWVSRVAVVLVCTSVVWGQTLTTGGLTGAIQDPSGAVIPHASITLTSIETGAVRKLISNVHGVYRFSQLAPGQYRLHITANGFKSADVGPITVPLSGVTTDNVTLQVGSMVQMIQVQGASPLIQTSNPNTTTTLTSRTLMTLPNPGEDLTYAALVAPGVSMNSTGGYGNFEVNGLPATSVNFSIDGMYYNDPFLNLNNSGATNMSLGLNGVAEMSENSTSYAVDQGHLGAMQINYITKSGTNQWHGNAYETWNGASLNSSDYFLNMEGQPKSSDVVNVFGA